jgi:hypothetical protein
MSIEELREKLRALLEDREDADTENDHVRADDLLLDYINDAEVSEAFNALEKWYA